MSCAEVKAKVLAVDAQKQRLSLGLAPHHIAEADASLLADGEAPEDAGSASGSDLDDDLAAGLSQQTAKGVHKGIAAPAVNPEDADNDDDDDVLDEGMAAIDSDEDDEGGDAELMAELRREVLAEQVCFFSFAYPGERYHNIYSS